MSTRISFAELQAEAERDGSSIAEVCLTRESRESGESRDELRRRMRERIGVMRDAAVKGFSGPQVSRSGLIRGGAYRLAAWAAGGGDLLGPSFTRLIAAALGAAEVNACMGRIVAAPTAGSSGVLPAVLLTLAEEKKIEEERLVAAFFTAGGLGLVIESLATLSGAEGGCQAEVGAASAMAAGALVEMLGGSPAQVGHAASFALKNLMGLICDPVLGLVEVPCVKRNAMGAVNAVACAEMALAGLESVFPFDRVVEAMGRAGRRLPEEFRETARGGLATIPLGERGV